MKRYKIVPDTITHIYYIKTDNGSWVEYKEIEKIIIFLEEEIKLADKNIEKYSTGNTTLFANLKSSYESRKETLLEILNKLQNENN